MCDLNWILRQNKKRINNIKKGKKKKGYNDIIGTVGEKNQWTVYWFILLYSIKSEFLGHDKVSMIV